MYPTQKVASNRAGLAMPLVIAALVIIGVLVVGALFASTQEYRIGRNNVAEIRAQTAAEGALGTLVSNWDLASNTRPVGDTLIRSYSSSGATATVRVTRLDGPFFWAESEALSGAAVEYGARRRVGLMLRLDMPDINLMGALTARGLVTVGGSTLVDGRDRNPTGWSCPAVGAAIAGLAMGDTVGGLKLPGCNVSKNCVEGSPKFVQDVAAQDTNTYFNYGNSSYSELAASANIVLPGGLTISSTWPVAVGGVCQTGVITNWGDPTRATPAGACESYYPIIHVQGDLHLSGAGKGQGILLVDGDLTASGGTEFYGPVIVRGYLRTTGTGAKFNGGVLAANLDLQSTVVLGNAGIFFSSCVWNTVLSRTSYPKPIRQRAWADMY